MQECNDPLRTSDIWRLSGLGLDNNMSVDISMKYLTSNTFNQTDAVFNFDMCVTVSVLHN